MSVAVYPDEALTEMLTATYGTTDVSLRLFSNNFTPVAATVLADLTEVSGNGYAAKTLAHASFTISALSPGAKAVYAQQTFTFSGAAGLIYGWYITNTGNTKLEGPVVRFDTPFNILSSGNTIKITPDLRRNGGL